MVVKSNKPDGLYIFNNKDPHQKTYINNISVKTWHRKLSHPSFKKMTHLKDHISCTNKSHLCHVCPLAKKRRLSFISNNIFPKHVFDLIHCDIWGSFQTFSYFRYWYFFFYLGGWLYSFYMSFHAQTKIRCGILNLDFPQHD